MSSIALIGGTLDASSALLSDEDVDALISMFVNGGWTMVWCGNGSGLAGRIARGVLARGGKAEAIVVRGDAPDDAPDGAVRHEVADYHERGRALFDRSEGAIVVPGGVGTLAELSELQAWRAAGLYTHPVVVMDPNRWFGAFRRQVAKMEDAGVAPAGTKGVVKFAVSTAAVTKELLRVR